MANFTLTCCSTADRPKSFFDGRHIPYACFHWNEGGQATTWTTSTSP